MVLPAVQCKKDGGKQQDPKGGKAACPVFFVDSYCTCWRLRLIGIEDRPTIWRGFDFTAPVLCTLVLSSMIGPAPVGTAYTLAAVMGTEPRPSPAVIGLLEMHARCTLVPCCCIPASLRACPILSNTIDAKT